MTQTSESATVGESLPGSAQGPGRQGGAAEKSYRVEIPVPPSPTPPQQSLKSPAAVCVCSENARTAPVSLDPVERGSRVARAGPSHRTEENRYSPSAASVRSKAFSPSVPVFSDKLSSPVRSGTSPVSNDVNHYSPSPPATSQHQTIDWKNYTTYKDYIDAKRLHTYGCRTIQERLDSLRAAASSGSAYGPQRTPPPPGAGPRGAQGSQVKRRSTSTDRGVDTSRTARTPSRSASQERLGGERTVTGRVWSRSASEDALPLSSTTGFTKPRARSCDYLGKQPGESLATVGDKAGFEDRLRLFRGEEGRANRQGPAVAALPYRSLPGKEGEGQGGALAYPPAAAPVFTKGEADSRTDCVILRPSRLPVKNPLSDPSTILSTIKTSDPLKDQRAVVIGNHISYPSPLHLQLRGRADSLKTESRAGAVLAARSSSCSGPSSKLPLPRHSESGVPASSFGSTAINGDVSQKPAPGGPVRTNSGHFQGVEGPDATVVVLRRDKNSGAPHVRPPSYVLALDERQKDETTKSAPLVKAGSVDGAMCWMSDSCRQRHHRRPGDAHQKSKHLDDSLDSIPFIGKTSGNCTK